MTNFISCEKTNELFKAVLSVNQNQPEKVLQLLKEIGVLKKNKIISIRYPIPIYNEHIFRKDYIVLSMFQ